MNYLAAMLIINIKDEAKAFWCFVYLLNRRNWREVYNNNTPKLMNLLELAKLKLQKEDPVLLNHLEQNDLDITSAFSQIYLTLFIYQIPLEISTRIFEFFILEGENILLKVLFRSLEHKRE